MTSGTESLMFETTVDGLVGWLDDAGVAEGELGTKVQERKYYKVN